MRTSIGERVRASWPGVDPGTRGRPASRRRSRSRGRGSRSPRSRGSGPSGGSRPPRSLRASGGPRARPAPGSGRRGPARRGEDRGDGHDQALLEALGPGRIKAREARPAARNPSPRSHTTARQADPPGPVAELGHRRAGQLAALRRRKEGRPPEARAGTSASIWHAGEITNGTRKARIQAAFLVVGGADQIAERDDHQQQAPPARSSHEAPVRHARPVARPVAQDSRTAEPARGQPEPGTGVQSDVVRDMVTDERRNSCASSGGSSAAASRRRHR